MKPYTVLLQIPDYVAETFGQETYLAHVRGWAPMAAVKNAQREAAKKIKVNNAGDFYPLITIAGHHDDLTSR